MLFRSGISLEGMMLKLKLQFFGHLMRRVDSLGKTLMVGGVGGRRRRGRQRMRQKEVLSGPLRLSTLSLESLEDCPHGTGWGHGGLDTTEQLHFHFSLSCIGEGNGNPLQCSCLENPMDGEAW